MRHVMTIAKRELSAYFTSPIGYIFMMVFVTASVGLYMVPFFAFPRADMRAFFSNLPLLLCVLIPAITMRIWAQERSENTWEMLLTFPMKAWELVAGKFLAAYVFFVLTLGTTLTVPMMLRALGNPDEGVLVASYLGTVLLGGYFLALGIFFSGFFKDQILSFIVTLLACFGVYLLGTSSGAVYIDGVVPGLGTVLHAALGVTGHFTPFTRGVIELADIGFFVVWTFIFLVLNVVYIDGRSRAGARLIFSTVLGLALVVGLTVNWLMAGASLGRYDVTEDKLFTISQASKNILQGLDTAVQIKLYISPKQDMPSGMTTMEQDISDTLEELRVASNGRLTYSVINLQASEVVTMRDTEAAGPEGDGEDDVIERRLLDKGVEPFTVPTMRRDQVANTLVYCSFGIAYKDKQEEIIPQIRPQDLDTLEYRLVSTIHKLARDTKPVVAIMAARDTIDAPTKKRQSHAHDEHGQHDSSQSHGQAAPDTYEPYEVLEQVLAYEGYEVKHVGMTLESPLPEVYDTLVVVNPRVLTDRQRWEINRALVSGKSVILAVQMYQWDYLSVSGQPRLNIRDENPGVNVLLETYGLAVDADILMDVNSGPLTMQMGDSGARAFDSPMHMLINNDSMAQDVSITGRLAPIFYLWGTALKLDAGVLAAHGLDARVLISTSERAWKASTKNKLTTDIFQNPNTNEGPYPLMALVRGQFPDAYAGKRRPVWSFLAAAAETDEAAALVPAPGQLIVLGCAQLFREEFFQAGNVDLFVNSVGAVTLGDDLVHVRGRKPIDRLVGLPDAGTRTLWKWLNYGLANGLIALVGIVGAVLRRRSRTAYTLAQLKTTEE